MNEELSTVKNALVTSVAANEHFERKLDQKEKDINKVVNERNILEEKNSANEKRSIEQIHNLELQIKAQKKH